LSLDYELFFAEFSGTVEKSIIEPTNALLEICDKFMIKLNFFVDSGYLVALKRYKDKFESLEKDYNLITSQIRSLSDNGHDIQLHIHPHWEDTIYDGERWVMNTKRYRIHKFNDNEIANIVKSYKEVLTDVVGNKIFAYRAGGWCIQPFEKIKKHLKDNAIWLDSTLYKDGYKDNSTHFFDFRRMPDKTLWKFEDDPMSEDKSGYFTEVPISSMKISPLFYIRYAIAKKLHPSLHKIMGDGKGVGREKSDNIRMLTRFTPAVASLDGYRMNYLQKMLDSYAKDDKKRHFVVMGHPKATNLYSLKMLHKFLSDNHTRHNFTTYSKEFN
jgi:hypothetical protein